MIEKTLKLPAAFLYLLPWALAHSEKLKDLDLACEFINKSINAYPNLVYLKEEINKQLISIDKFWKNLDDIHREMLNLEG